METTAENPEQAPNPEGEENNADVVDVYLQRHGERGPDGWLTENGVEQVRSATRHIVEQYLGPDEPPVTFFILNSPSAHFVDGEPEGKRAEHSGRIAASTIEDAIAEHGLSSEQAQLHEFGKTVSGTRAHERLSEPNYYYVEGSDNPTGYYDALIETLGKEGREEGFFSEIAELEDIRQEVGAESSSDVSNRTLYLLKVIDRYSAGYHRKYPDRKLVFLLESHGDVIRSTVLHGLGVEASQGWQPGTGEGVKLELNDGQISLDYNGMMYDVDLGSQRS